MKTTKTILLLCSFTFISFNMKAVNIQASGPVSVNWSSGEFTPLNVNLSLQSNPGNIFNITTFSLQFFVDDRAFAIQELTAFGQISVFNNVSVALSSSYLRSNSEVSEVLIFDTATDFISESNLQNDAVDGTDNYLGISFLDINDRPHYGWLQFELNSYSDGTVASRFISGQVNDAPETASTTGTVPEPTSIALLLATAAGGLLMLRSHRKRKG